MAGTRRIITWPRNEAKAIQAYADKHFNGNYSETVRRLLRLSQPARCLGIKKELIYTEK